MAELGRAKMAILILGGSILIGAGIDGRGGMPAVFNGLPKAHLVILLHLTDVPKLDSGAVWMTYRIQQ